MMTLLFAGAIFPELFEKVLRYSDDQPALVRRDLQVLAPYLERDFENSGLSRDATNSLRAWLLVGNLPRAVVVAQQGLLKNPADGELQRDLELLRDAVGYAEGHRPPRDTGWRASCSSMVVDLAFLVIVLLCTIAVGLRHTIGGRPSAVLVGLGVAMLFAWVVCVVQQQRELQYQQREPLAVVARREPLRRGNGYSYPAVLAKPLLAGQEVRVLHERGDWFQVKLPDGTRGWLPKAAALVILREKSPTPVQDWDDLELVYNKNKPRGDGDER
jgi:hypothetical protein